MDISWISSQAKEIHSLFVSAFYVAAAILLTLGIFLDYFKMPLGGVPSTAQLVGRALIAAILLVAYPEISNAVASVADAVSDQIGSLNAFHNVLKSAGAALKEHSWSWTSIGDTLLSVVAFVVYYILYLSVFFFDAAIVYCLTLLYIFSPIMIVFYILPQTASLTGGLFRSLFEVVTWKIVFAVLGTLLWSTALNNFNQSGNGHFITLLALTLILAFSMLLTPIVVKNLISGTLSSVAAQTAGLSAVGLSAGLMSPAALSAITKTGTKKLGTWGAKLAHKGATQGYKASRSFVKNQFKKKITALPNNVIPFPGQKDEE